MARKHRFIFRLGRWEDKKWIWLTWISHQAARTLQSWPKFPAEMGFTKCKYEVQFWKKAWRGSKGKKAPGQESGGIVSDSWSHLEPCQIHAISNLLDIHRKLPSQFFDWQFSCCHITYRHPGKPHQNRTRLTHTHTHKPPTKASSTSTNWSKWHQIDLCVWLLSVYSSTIQKKRQLDA